jgi:hypothetical protein
MIFPYRQIVTSGIPQLHKPHNWGNPYPDQKVTVARFRAVFAKSYPRFNFSVFQSCPLEKKQKKKKQRYQFLFEFVLKK